MDCIRNKAEEYKIVIKHRLSEHRYVHSLNVADAAETLAKKYGANADKAYVAGILHDITKQETVEKQIEIIENGGGKLLPLEKFTPLVYHQISGMYYCINVLGVDDEDILGAIRWHTTGKSDMTLLEKVVFTADFISADRNYPDVDVMRGLANESLEKAMLYSLKYTICDLVQKGNVIHPDTLNCYNYILQNNTEKE